MHAPCLMVEKNGASHLNNATREGVASRCLPPARSLLPHAPRHSRCSTGPGRCRVGPGAAACRGCLAAGGPAVASWAAVWSRAAFNPVWPVGRSPAGGVARQSGAGDLCRLPPGRALGLAWWTGAAGRVCGGPGTGRARAAARWVLFGCTRRDARVMWSWLGSWAGAGGLLKAPLRAAPCWRKRCTHFRA
jgi:hypothetical protein